MKRVAALVLGAALLFAGITAIALEGGGVAVVETRGDDGTQRETRVWYVAEGESLLLEAATPESPWLQDARQRPELRVRREGRSRAYVARVDASREGHQQIRAAFRAKYGWRDAWVALLQDTARSLRVRLEPAP